MASRLLKRTTPVHVNCQAQPPLVARFHRSPSSTLFRFHSHSHNFTAMSGPQTSTGPGTKPSSSSASGRLPISQIPKTWTFTTRLPADCELGTPEMAHSIPRDAVQPRLVKGAMFSFVRPVPSVDPKLLAVSPRAAADLGIADIDSSDFLDTVSGNRLWGWVEDNNNARAQGGNENASVAVEDDETESEDQDMGKGKSEELYEDSVCSSNADRRYPWAQCYGGFQFGVWAGQLGDGRAISLFETQRVTSAQAPPPAPISVTSSSQADLPRQPLLVNHDAAVSPALRPRYELQLKGAGLTPYSRFADGRAVLRSSIREWVVSEYLSAIAIPSTRALSLVRLPHVRAIRENGPEPAAIVLRFAESWVRVGSFDLLRVRNDRALTRRLADYVAEEVLPGSWAGLCARVAGTPVSPQSAASVSAAEADGHDDDLSESAVRSVRRGVPRNECQGPVGIEENRYARLYREIVRRNAFTVARWQAYGFTNGVLNTDNTSVAGLSVDFGPFAFIDKYDPAYTPNHDDHLLRYCLRNQPTIIWWNLVRLGESLGELMGMGSQVDDSTFVAEGLKGRENIDSVVKRAEKLIARAGAEYRAVYMGEFRKVMSLRLGFQRTLDGTDNGEFAEIVTTALNILKDAGLDYHFFFRRLSEMHVSVGDDAEKLKTEEGREELVKRFYYGDGRALDNVPEASSSANSYPAQKEREIRRSLAAWLDKWRNMIVAEWGVEEADRGRIEMMKRVNPHFVPRGWVLDEVIRRVEREDDQDVLRRIMHMCLHPFEDHWDGRVFKEGEPPYKGDRDEELRWVTDVKKEQRAMQCSCSS